MNWLLNWICFFVQRNSSIKWTFKRYRPPLESGLPLFRSVILWRWYDKWKLWSKLSIFQKFRVIFNRKNHESWINNMRTFQYVFFLQISKQSHLHRSDIDLFQRQKVIVGWGCGVASSYGDEGDDQEEDGEGEGAGGGGGDAEEIGAGHPERDWATRMGAAESTLSESDQPDSNQSWKICGAQIWERQI